MSGGLFFADVGCFAKGGQSSSIICVECEEDEMSGEGSDDKREK